MKINARDRIIIVITTCMLLSSVIFSAANSSDTNSNRKRELITHEPIYIDGNDDFVIGENGVVSGSGTQDDPFLISGWDINASTAHGIHILNTDVYFIVRGCYIHDGNDTDYYGILLEYVENGRVDTVSSTRNRRGIVLGEKSKEIAIANSSFNHNAGGISCHGPWMSGDEGCSFIHVINNTVSHNQYIGISCYGRDSTIEGNTITYNYHGIHSGDGGEEYGGNVAYINNTISYNAGNGIVFDHNHENIIMGNIITYNGYDPIPMYQNDEDTHGGLWLLCWEYHVDVIDNTICFNYGRGLLFSSAEECRVLNNTITQNYGDGVLLRRAGQYPNSMYHNMIAQNTKNGILISEEHGRVKNFNIAYNMIRDNGEYGFYCNASSLFWPPNLIHHNNFINNLLGNAYDESEDTNIWDDNMSEGNYWDDYDGVDVDGDGIGDTPYDKISGGENQDRYPLMTPWGLILGDLDYDGDVDLSDLAALLGNYGTTSGAIYWMGDLDGDGDVDLSDLASLLANYGTNI